MYLTKRFNNWLTNRFESAAAFVKKSKPVDNVLQLSARKSHDLMTWAYFVSNFSMWGYELGAHFREAGDFDLSKLNPANDVQTSAGFVGSIGATVNRFQNRYPLAFNICGGFNLAKVLILMAEGWNKPGGVENAIGNIPSLVTSVMMMTDTRHSRQKQAAANDNPATTDSNLNLTRRFYIGAFLLAGGALAMKASIQKQDANLMLYWGIQLVGSAGMLLNDEKVSAILQADPKKEKKPQALEL